MPSGEEFQSGAFTTVQTASLEKALARAHNGSGLTFRIYVGALDAARASAVAIHRELPAPARSVLVAVDPEQRLLEIVTGEVAREHLDDQACRLACLTMTSRFAIGDIAAGLRDGTHVLAEHSRRLRVLHTDEPENA